MEVELTTTVPGAGSGAGSGAATYENDEYLEEGLPGDAKSSRPASRSYCREVVELAKRTWPVLLGNTLEWYEFAVYGFVEHYIQLNFFKGDATATWLAFAATFVTRPIGGVLLGSLADTFGRALAVNISLAGMLLGTVCQGLLPSYFWGQEEGRRIGMVLLFVCRVLQGICAGGENGAVCAYLTEESPLRVLGMSSALGACGGTLAWGFGAGITAILSTVLDEDQMMTWGWRIPFLVCLGPGLVAVVGRRGIHETELFQAEKRAMAAAEAALEGAGAEPAPGSEGGKEAEQEGRHGFCGRRLRRQSSANQTRQPSELLRLLSSAPWELTIGFLTTLVASTMWYVANIWVTSSVLTPKLGAKTSLRISVLAQTVRLVMTLVTGWLIDLQGLGWVMLFTSISVAFTALPVWLVMIYFDHSVVVSVVCVGVIYGALTGMVGCCIYLFVSELFPTRLRALGMCMSFNICLTFLGGFGPLIAAQLFAVATIAPGIYISLSGAVSATAVIVGLWLQHKGKVRLTHRRATPYFGQAEVSAADPVPLKVPTPASAGAAVQC